MLQREKLFSRKDNAIFLEKQLRREGKKTVRRYFKGMGVM